MIPMPRPMSDLIHAHFGRPALVLGGGDSLPAHGVAGPPDAVHIGANEHACKIGLRCEYIVAVDNIREKVTPYGVPVITSRRWGQFRMFKQPSPCSGPCAAWAAWVMGCAPIIIGGMDCYVGGTYCHDPKAKSSGKSQTLDNHLSRWATLRDKFPRAAIRTLGGPTLKVFAAYDPAETGFDIASREDILRSARGVLVEFTREIDFAPHKYRAGECAELTEAEARHTRRMKSGSVKQDAAHG